VALETDICGVNITRAILSFCTTAGSVGFLITPSLLTISTIQPSGAGDLVLHRITFYPNGGTPEPLKNETTSY